jgi:hypothetical protein
METLDEALDYLIHGGGSVALFDATNSTVQRRDLIVQMIRQQNLKLQIMFLESQCVDSAVGYSLNIDETTNSSPASRIKHAPEVVRS